jgi:DNA-binding transcriptional LysR family regulator
MTIWLYVGRVEPEIELRKMALVVAVAEEGNFSRAALRCHLSQSALSRQIGSAESALGTRLFQRQPRSAVLTPSGKLFVREARRTLEQGSRTVSLVQALAKQQVRPVLVGLSLLSDLPKFNTIIKEAKRAIADVQVVVHTTYTPELTLGLLRGDIDLAVADLPLRERGIRFHSLTTEPLAVALPEQFDTPKQTAIRIAELNAAPLVLLSQFVDPGRAAVDDAMAATSTRAFKVHDAGGIPELLDEVALNNRIGLLRQSATRFQRQGVVYKPLAEPIRLECALAWRTDHRWPAFMSIRDALIAYSQQP